MVPNVPFTVELQWNKPEFYLMQPATNKKRYWLEPTEAFLHIDKAELSHAVLTELSHKIAKNPVIYHTNGML